MKQLQDKGILLGIKVDKGVVPLFGTDGETTIQARRPPRLSMWTRCMVSTIVNAGACAQSPAYSTALRW